MRAPDVVTVAVTRVDGGVTVMRVVTTEYQADDTPRWTVDPTPAYIDGLIVKHNWQGPQAPVSWRLVPNDYVDETTDSGFRDAWRDGGTARPEVRMDRARDIHRDRLRAMRAERFAVLDAEYLQADERGDPSAKREIAQEKQRWRDAPADPRIEAADTVADLVAVTL